MCLYNVGQNAMGELYLWRFDQHSTKQPLATRKAVGIIKIDIKGKAALHISM